MKLPRQSPTVSVKEIDGQLLVLDRPNGKLHELNATARFIWELCNGQNTTDEIAEAMVATFDIDSETASQDVMVTLEQFEASRLIEDADPVSFG